MSQELLAELSREARALQMNVDNEWEPYGSDSASSPSLHAGAEAPISASAHSEAQTHDKSDEPDAAVLSIRWRRTELTCLGIIAAVFGYAMATGYKHELRDRRASG